MNDQLIKIFIEKWLEFDLQLREKRGFNDAMHQDLMGLLKQIKERLNNQNTIPKNLAEIFLDMWGAMTSSADLYDSDDRDEIYQAADHLTGCARDICIK